MAGPRVLGLVLAGAAGKRLAPLTADRAKSAVPFGGLYRLVDFALSNLVNGGIYRICVLTQYKSHSLDRHITTAWRLNSLLNNYVAPVPAQQRLGPHWQTGSADAIYQSLNLIHSDRPDLVAVFGADHVYRMDPRADDRGASGLGRRGHGGGDPGPASGGGGLRRRAGRAGRPPDRGVPGEARRTAGPARLIRTRPSRPWATTCSTATCWWRRCARTPPTTAASTASAATSSRCWCGSAPRTSMTSCRTRCPAPTGATRATGGRWGRSTPTSRRTWTCARSHPLFNLYNDRWPILTQVPPQPPAKFVHDDGDRVGRAVNSLVSNGVIVSGGLVRDSVLSPGVRVDELGPGLTGR